MYIKCIYIHSFFIEENLPAEKLGALILHFQYFFENVSCKLRLLSNESDLQCDANIANN